MDWLQSIITAIFTLGDTMGEGLVALTLGFAVKPMGIGFLVGAGAMFLFGSVVPVSFQVEGLTVVSRQNKGDWRGICYTAILAGIIGAILGAIGVFSALADFIGSGIQGGMMVGAGLILTRVAFEMLQEDMRIGITSAVVAYVLYLLVPSADWKLIIALVGSVLAGFIAGRIVGSYESVVSNTEIEKVRFIPRSWDEIKSNITKGNVIRATLAILALRTGTSIAYGGIDARVLAGVEPMPDAVNIYSGISGIASGMFGGGNMEPIISATAATPHPVFSGVLMMLLMAAILLFGILPKLGKWVPTQSIVGFLFVLGTLVIIPENLSFLMEAPVPGAVAAGVTAAAIDPFLGMVVGIVVRALLGLAG